MKEKKKTKKKPLRQIRDYDETDTVSFIDQKHSLKFEDIGLSLPELPPTQVISIRLPSQLLNQIKAESSQRDIPYQALIKLFLSEGVNKLKKRSA